MPAPRAGRLARVCLTTGAALALWAGAAAADMPPRADALLRQMRACLAQTRLDLPCMQVSRTHRFVVIKDHDPAKSAAYLIVPSFPVSGIEDPKAWRPPVSALWREGWQVGVRLLDQPRQDLGLAINSRAGRTQNLLHIHISCVAPAIRDALDHIPIGRHWAGRPVLVWQGQAFDARTVASLDESPFALLRELPAARRDMADQSLAVVGRPSGYVLLADTTLPHRPAAAETLLDEDCKG